MTVVQLYKITCFGIALASNRLQILSLCLPHSNHREYSLNRKCNVADALYGYDRMTHLFLIKILAELHFV